MSLWLLYHETIFSAIHDNLIIKCAERKPSSKSLFLTMQCLCVDKISDINIFLLSFDDFIVTEDMP